MGIEVFCGCSSLTHMTLPDSIGEMERWVFKDCVGLTKMTLPKSLEKISWRLFEGCTNLSQVDVPHGVSSIGGFAFAQCSCLREIQLPQNVQEIEESAFAGCTQLSSVTLSKDAKLQQQVFEGCPALFDAQGFLIVDGVLYGYQGQEDVLVVPEHVTVIGYNALKNQAQLTKITLPTGLQEIGMSAFRGCSCLSNVNLSSHVLLGKGAFYGCPFQPE